MNALDLENPDHTYLFAFRQADEHLRESTRNSGSVGRTAGVRFLRTPA